MAYLTSGYFKQGGSSVITGRMTEHEYIAAHLLACRKVRSVLQTILIVVFLCGVVIFFVGSWETGFKTMLGACGALVGHFLQYRIYVRWKAGRLFAQIRNMTDATYSWDENNLYWNDVKGQAATSWDTFIKARENDQVMILYFNDALYQIVPKRWFNKATDLAAFRTHLAFIY